LDEIAAADTSGINVFGPTEETKAALEEYYTEGPGSPGYTTAVDYTTTSSGEDYSVAAAADDTDIVGGTDFTTYEGETVEVRELPSGTKYYVDMSGNYVALAPEEDVTVDTFSASEITTPVSEIAGPFDGTQTYEETILEPGTGGISGIRLGDPMTQQLATELGVNYFEGDTIQSDDLIRLSDLGFDVSQADLTQARSEVPLDVDVTVTTADLLRVLCCTLVCMVEMAAYIQVMKLLRIRPTSWTMRITSRRVVRILLAGVVCLTTSLSSRHRTLLT
jgi:hypothetical protein